MRKQREFYHKLGMEVPGDIKGETCSAKQHLDPHRNGEWASAHLLPRPAFIMSPFLRWPCASLQRPPALLVPMGMRGGAEKRLVDRGVLRRRSEGSMGAPKVPGGGVQCRRAS